MPIMADSDAILSLREAVLLMSSSYQNLGGSSKPPHVQFEFKNFEARDAFVRSVIKLAEPPVNTR